MYFFKSKETISNDYNLNMTELLNFTTNPVISTGISHTSQKTGAPLVISAKYEGFMESSTPWPCSTRSSVAPWVQPQAEEKGKPTSQVELHLPALKNFGQGKLGRSFYVFFRIGNLEHHKIPSQ